MNSNRMRS